MNHDRNERWECLRWRPMRSVFTVIYHLCDYYHYYFDYHYYYYYYRNHLGVYSKWFSTTQTKLTPHCGCCRLLDDWTWGRTSELQITVCLLILNRTSKTTTYSEDHVIALCSQGSWRKEWTRTSRKRESRLSSSYQNTKWNLNSLPKQRQRKSRHSPDFHEMAKVLVEVQKIEGGRERGEGEGARSIM